MTGNPHNPGTRTVGRPRRACRVSGMYDLTEGVAWCAFLCGRRTIHHLCPPFLTISIPNLFDSESRTWNRPRRFLDSGIYVTTAGTTVCALLRGWRTTPQHCPPHFIFIGGAYRWATTSSDRGSPPSSTPACPRRGRRSRVSRSIPNSRRAVRGAGRTGSRS